MKLLEAIREIEQWRNGHNTLANMSDDKIAFHVHSIITLTYDKILKILKEIIP